MKRRMLLQAAGLPWAAPAQSAMPDPQGNQPSAPSVPLKAIADGASHPLSSRFTSLEVARSAFPAATSLNDEIDWCALQAAITQAAAPGSGAVYVPNTGRAYVLNRTLEVDPNRVTVRSDGATLAFPKLAEGGTAIVFRPSGSTPYGHERHVFAGFELIGPGRSPHTTGLLFRSDVDTSSSRAMIRDCTIHGFVAGILFGDHAYGIGFSHVSVFDCEFDVYAPYHLKDAGETVSFFQCYLFNSGCCIYNGGAFDLKFFGCSLDFSTRLIWDNNGGIDLVGCRLEIAAPRVQPIHCNGGRINMFGGFFLINGTHEQVYVSELFALSSPGASLDLFGVQGWNWRTTTRKLTAGPGKIRWHQGTEIAEAPAEIGYP
jgi:hypothetical protein